MYDYCVRNKLVDAALIAKWKKPGYERLCSTYVINTKNYKFGTVSICRVPKHALGPDTVVEDPNTGCLGCASGPGGQRNIFGNKYGQYLAAIQVAREEERARRAKAGGGSSGTAASGAKAARGAKAAAAADEDTDEGEGEGEGEGSDAEDGPRPGSIWAVSEAERTLESADMENDEHHAGAAAEAEREAAATAKRAAGSASSSEGSSDGKRPRY